MTNNLNALAVGETFQHPVPTGADVKKATKAASQYGVRNDKGFRCKTDRKTRIMVITRVR